MSVPELAGESDARLDCDSCDRSPLDVSREELVPVRAKPDQPLHLTLLLVAGVVLVLAVVLEVQNHTEVHVPILNAPLPELCTFRRTVGLDCPGCGLTRCFISLAHGRLGDAWSYNPVGIMFFLIVAFQVPYRTIQIWRVRRGLTEFSLHRIGQWSLLGIAALLLLQWVVRTILELTR